MADSGGEVEIHDIALREHELRRRLALATRAPRRISREIDSVSYEANPPQQFHPATPIGAVAAIADHAIPIASGRKGLTGMRWQINRQTHRSRRREEIEVQIAFVRHSVNQE